MASGPLSQYLGSTGGARHPQSSGEISSSQMVQHFGTLRPGETESRAAAWVQIQLLKPMGFSSVNEKRLFLSHFQLDFKLRGLS